MFDPDLFWQFAETLIKESSVDECKCRTAAGRAYYAFFLTVRNALETRHKVGFTHSGTDHSQVIRELRHRQREQMADALDELLRLREHADYDMGTQLNINRVSFAIDKARNPYSYAKTL